MDNKKRGVICLLIATIIWGYGFVAIKQGLNYVSPLCLVFFRYIIGLVAIIIVYNVKLLKGLSFKQIKDGGICGLLLLSAILFQIIGCNYTTVGKNAFLCSTYVVVTPLLGFIFKGEEPKKRTIISVIMCTIGIAVLSLKGDLSIQLGDGLSIFSGISYAVYFMACQDKLRSNRPMSLYFIMLIVGSVVTGLIAILGGNMPTGSIPIEGWLSIGYCGLFGMFLGFLLQIIGQRYVEPTLTGLVLTLESVFGTILSVLILKEAVTLNLLVGSGLIFSSIILCKIRA